MASIARALVQAVPASARGPQTTFSAEDLALRNAILASCARFARALRTQDKYVLQNHHVEAKRAAGGMDVRKLLGKLKQHKSYFPLGDRIQPSRIEPVLIEVTARSREEDLFKLCRSSWSMPYSKGYGRRLRFVVMDAFHDAVIGIIGLQSAPADLACRDVLVGETPNKLRWVNSTLDAYTIGAVPPYSNLIGGKLVAGMLSADEVRQAYWRAYAGRRSIMEGTRFPQPLLGITTTSAFGRSSIYNRLRYEERLLAEPIGFTKGFGTIHLEGVYPLIAEWLEKKGDLVPAGFGNGPKVRWQNIQHAVTRLGLPGDVLLHGLKREVFLFRHVGNFEASCRSVEVPSPLPLKASEWAKFWKDRWAQPRADSTNKWRWVSAAQTIEQSLLQVGVGPRKSAARANSPVRTVRGI